MTAPSCCYKAITNACINWTQRRPPVVSLDAAEQGRGADRLSLADKSDAGPEHRAIHGELEAAVAAALAELPVTQTGDRRAAQPGA